MKKLVLALAIILVVGTGIIYYNEEGKYSTTNTNYYELKEYFERYQSYKVYRLVTTYEEYQDLVSKTNIEINLGKNNFNNKNYLYILVDNSHEDFEDNIDVTLDKEKVRIVNHNCCGLCYHSDVLLEIPVDKDVTDPENIKVNHSYANKCDYSGGKIY